MFCVFIQKFRFSGFINIILKCRFLLLSIKKRLIKTDSLMKTSSRLLFSFLGSSQIYISFEERRLLLILYDLSNENLNVKQSKEDVPGGLSPLITVLKSLLQATVEFVSIFQRPERKRFPQKVVKNPILPPQITQNRNLLSLSNSLHFH